MEYKKYPAQMLEVAGELSLAPAKFENPAKGTFTGLFKLKITAAILSPGKITVLVNCCLNFF